MRQFRIYNERAQERDAGGRNEVQETSPYYDSYHFREANCDESVFIFLGTIAKNRKPFPSSNRERSLAFFGRYMVGVMKRVLPWFVSLSMTMTASVYAFQHEQCPCISATYHEIASLFEPVDLLEKIARHDVMIHEIQRESGHGMIELSDGYFVNVTTLESLIEEEKIDQTICVSWGLGSIQIEANPYLDFHLTMDAKSGRKSLSNFFCQLPLVLQSCGISDRHISCDKCLSQSFVQGARCAKPIKTSWRAWNQREELMFQPLGLVRSSDQEQHFTNIIGPMDSGNSFLPFILVVFLVMGVIGYIRYQKPH
jgi:hypothetical protein